MIQEITVTLATPADLPDLVALLQAQQLPTKDVPANLENFILLKENGELIGSAGLQIYGPYALLRSLAVDTTYQKKGFGITLYKAAAELALSNRVEELFLITTTASAFFLKLGFIQIERYTVPDIIAATAQFSGICPSSGIVMWKKM